MPIRVTCSCGNILEVPGRRPIPDLAPAWSVPADFADPRVDVILSAQAGDGKEAFQTFALTTGE